MAYDYILKTYPVAITALKTIAGLVLSCYVGKWDSDLGFSSFIVIFC
jgi:hypothetical protein